jgi:hypothetical protein
MSTGHTFNMKEGGAHPLLLEGRAYSKAIVFFLKKY